MSEKTGKTEQHSNIFRRSLNHKTFIITLLLTFGIGVTVLVAGFLLYLVGVLRGYYVNTWNQANAEASILEQTDYREICDKILRLYDGMPAYEKRDGQSAEYKNMFRSFMNEDYERVQKAMRNFQDRNGPINAFIVALDEKNERMIYLIDADPGVDTTCIPGTWDYYPRSQLDVLINGRELTAVDKENGLTRGFQAVLTNREGFGYRVTAGSTLYSTDRYTVMVCVDEKLDTVTRSSIRFLIQYIILLVTVVLIAAFTGSRLMRKELVRPINKMAVAAAEYGSDKERKVGIRHFDGLNIKTGDELEQLATALRDMEEDLEVYMDDLTRATADKERINTELSLAAGIQKGMLLAEFPDRPEFDICATMEPAKHVGGDFYDVIMIDDDHLAIEIADVSGKGIPAALFMMAAKIMIADGVRADASPASILEQANSRICARNEEEMFITVWLAILEISTGKLRAANAGHEFPIIVHGDGSAEVVQDKHGFVVGGMSGMKYTDYELQLSEGDKILVYTDGATEATSVDDELFGMERLTEAAGSAGRAADPHMVIGAVRKAIAGFTVGAEQFDDLTMLCLEYRGTKNNKQENH